MNSRNPHRPYSSGTQAARSCGAVTLAAGLAMLLAPHAYAAVTPGETFVYAWTEISGNHPGAMGKLDFTLGPASTTMSGWFTLSAFAVSSSTGGFCGVCSPETENLSSVLFDPATDGVVGSITGTFLGHGGGTHTFDLVTTNLPDGSWTFTNKSPGGTVIDKGTYTTAVAPKAAVDEPATLLLLIPAGVALIAARRRRSR